MHGAKEKCLQGFCVMRRMKDRLEELGFSDSIIFDGILERCEGKSRLD